MSRLSPAPDGRDRDAGLPAQLPRRRHADVDWTHEWHDAWKPHVDNAWFQYQDDVYTAWWRERGPVCDRAPSLDGSGEPPQMLQTDAFNEACRLPSLDRILPSVRRTVMDISFQILHDALPRARAREPRMRSCSTDVRRLAFRREVFDVVFSPSTLDHFGHSAEITLALRELRRVLRVDGRLLITLDNPRNPVLWVRQRLYRIGGCIGGLIPFAMGRTLSRARLVEALKGAGFEVLDSRYVLHTPRVVGLWLGEWAARAGWARMGARLRSLFNALERLLRRLPTRAWTGHFVAVDCVRRG